MTKNLILNLTVMQREVINRTAAQLDYRDYHSGHNRAALRVVAVVFTSISCADSRKV